MVFGRVGLVGALGLVVLLSGLSSCGGGSSPAGPGTPTAPPAPIATSTPTSTPTAVPTTPPAGASTTCPYGNGTLSASCGVSASAYVSAVDNAITALTKAQPALFNMNEQAGPGQYRILQLPEYMSGVVQQLQAAGFCAEAMDLQFIQLKKGNEFSERYAIATSGGNIRRGEGAYRDSCRPAVFPVPDEEHIDAVRVHFFGINCAEGRTPPDNAEKILPLGCTGNVSATPKDRNNKDVDPKIHGSAIHWEQFQGEGENLAKVSDYPGQPFNKVVDPLNEGFFTLCATVKTVRGCFGFHIVR
jgi:hypothetical protein